MILVTGATGKVGRQVVLQLLKRGGHRVRALTRDPGSARLPGGVDVVRGDLSDPSTLGPALDGIESVFLVWPTLAADAAAPEVIPAIAGPARRVVYLSTIGAGDEVPGNPVGDSHAQIERLIRATGVDWTFLRGGGFAGNDLGWAPAITGDGVVREPFAGHARSLIHEADLAEVGVRALTETGHVGRAYDLTGPQALTQRERLDVIGEVVGRDLRFEELPLEAARAQFETWLPPGAVDATLRAMAEGASVPETVTRTFEELTGHPARTYRSWVVDHVEAFSPDPW